VMNQRAEEARGPLSENRPMLDSIPGPPAEGGAGGGFGMASRPEKRTLELLSNAVEGSIAERFARIVSQAPDAVAIVDQEAAWTYAELDQRSDRLASAIGGGRNSTEPVLLLFDRVSTAIIAMLACIKIGRPYVPLSPSDPVARIDHIREDSSATLLLTEASCGRMAEEIASSALCLFDVQVAVDADSPSGPLPLVSPDALVWILYTSGSTGLPKGVMQTHRNILRYVINYTRGLDLSCEDRIALLYSYTSNAGNHEIFCALLNGAAICPFDVRRQGVAPLASWIEETGITIYSSVPTLFRRFAEDLRGEHTFPTLRHVMLKGEPVYKRDLEAFRSHFTDGCSLVNRFGSTETGTVRWYFVNGDTEITSANVPIGFAAPDNEVLLLDEDGHPVPIGESGEIVVQSPHLSPGYWRRPDLTDKAFFGKGDRRCYRTGDVGRMLPGGCLVHLGRQDAQVNIRGHRIEVAEIEAALLAHPAIENVMVVPREDHPDDRRLVAYYTLKQGERHPTVPDLRRCSADRLPDYMVPNAFVPLPEFPLAPNGKIDRSALPPPGSERPCLETPHVAPRTPIEKELADLWRELLHLNDVGVSDSFFELGGHSLLATRLLARVQEAFGVDVDIRFLFEQPSIAALAEDVLARMAVKDEATPEVDNP
jgi:amino acid adenylation domain-containing protein